MIVIDASVAIEIILQSPKATSAARAIDAGGGVGHAPHLIDIEILHTLRRYEALGVLSDRATTAAMVDYREMPLVRYPHVELALRAWELRRNITAYDATYVALAEALDAPLLTCDGRLARAPGHRAQIELIE